MKNVFDGVKAILFDLDGTVYFDGVLIGQADETLDYLRSKNVSVGFLTNNSSKTDDEYYDRLKSIDIWRDGDLFLSSLGASAVYLNKHYAGKTVYPMATAACTEYLKNAGIILPEKGKESDADVLLLAFDREFNYQKLVIANELMVKGAVYVATHPDDTCPAVGISVPDLGSFMQMFKKSSGRTADVIIGKPYSYMADIIAEKLGLNPQEILMVGDRLHTDMQFGINAGLKTALVLSGETSKEEYENSGVKVDAVIPDVNALKEFF